MAGSGEKKSRARRISALLLWGGVSLAAFLANVLLLAVFSRPALLSRAGLAIVVAQALVHAVSVWRIAEAAAFDDDAHGSLEISAGTGKRDGCEMWKDLVYVNCFVALLRPLTTYGWWIWLAVVPTFAAWRTAAAFRSFFSAVMPAASGAAGGAGQDVADFGAPSRSSKRQRQEDAAEKRRKGR